MPIKIETNPKIMEQAISDLATACNEEIALSDRPTDASPLKALVAIFVVNKSDLADWPARVPIETWVALEQLTQRAFLCVSCEELLQSEFFALGQADLASFRRGVPILKFVTAFSQKGAFSVGGRTKHSVEIKIRKALEFEVFRREIEIGALLSARADLRADTVTAVRGSGLEFLRQNVWVEGVPFKWDAEDKKLSKGDRQTAGLERLRFEGEMLSTKFVPTAKSPADVERRILDQIKSWKDKHRSAAEYDVALSNAARPVNILMKACAYVTELTAAKYALSKATHRAEQRAAKRAEKDKQLELDLTLNGPKRPRWRPLNPILNPMTKHRHQFFSECPFSPAELAFVALVADVDPNLLSTRHVLATPEYELARMLCRLYSRQQLRPEFADLRKAHDLVFDNLDQPALFPEVRAFLRNAALDLASIERWSAWFDNPAEPLLPAVK